MSKKENTMYEIDFSKVESYEDVIMILKSLNIKYTQSAPGLKNVIHLVKPINND